ncbi:hypothetical protein PROCOU_11373 [Listeria rocourtiae FSL F6-920]|nr:hypothetical protein PROCOU_11373 [Listeria rocourtiae FSL F6-920]
MVAIIMMPSKKSGQTLDSMQDSAIDSYGPMNQYITVRNNQINLSASANKVNPNNPLIAKKMAAQNSATLRTIYRYKSEWCSIRIVPRQYHQY